jgi:hypothetical protein
MMVMALDKKCWNNEKGYHYVVSEIEFVYTNSIYFALPDDAPVVRYILIFYIQILSQFVNPPSDTLLRYFNTF